MVIENIQHQLINTSELYKEKLVAIKKLEWWIEEANRVFTSSPNHPTLKAFVKIKNTLVVDQHSFIRLFADKAAILNGVDINTNADLDSHINQQYLRFEQIKAQILLQKKLDSISEKWVNEISQAMEKIRYIYLLAHHKFHHIFLLPNINKNSTQNEQLLSLEKLSYQILNDEKKLKLEIPDKTLNPLFNRYKLHIKLLKLMKKNKFKVERERIELSPLQMLFCTK